MTTVTNEMVDAKVNKVLEKVEILREQSQSIEAEIAEMGNYKTRTFFTLDKDKLKLPTLNLQKLLEVGDEILQKAKISEETLYRLGLSDEKREPVLVQGYTVDDWFYDLKICVLKIKKNELLEKSIYVRDKALSLESDLGKRKRNVDALLESLEDVT